MTERILSPSGECKGRDMRTSVRLPRPMATTTPDDEYAVILFDGVCNLCNGFVNFVIDRDAAGYFTFAALQSEAADALLDGALDGAGQKTTTDRAGGSILQSVVLVEGGHCYRKSTAVLRIARHLGGGWPLLTVLLALPRPLRDTLYDWAAAHRYDWFGQRDQCRIPTPELQDRFLG